MVANGFVGNRYTGPRSQVRPKFPHRGIKSNRGLQRGAVVSTYVEGLPVPGHQVHQTSMRNLDALGLSGRTRGVNHVRQIVGRDVDLLALDKLAVDVS